MNPKVSFGEVLTKAWQIVWKFKVLWIFGILAGCASGNSGSRFNFNSGNYGGGSGGSGVNNGFDQFFRQFQNLQPGQVIQQVLGKYGAIIAVVIVLLCVLWFVFYFLGIMGKTGLIKGASKADAGATSMRFGELWTESTPYFWRLFGLNLLVGLPFFIVIVLLVLGLFYFVFTGVFNGGGAGFGGMLVGFLGLFIGVMCFLGLIMTVVGMIVEQAQNAIVLDDMRLFQGISRGWVVFKSAWLTIILMAIVLAVISGVVGLVIVLPFLGVILFAGVGAFASGAVTNFSGASQNNYLVPLIIGGCCAIIYLPVMILLGGILQAYVQSAWTLVYRRLTAPEVEVAPAQA